MTRLDFDIKKKYKRSKKVRVVQEVRCWWVIFDVNGNAPADADIVACSSEALAKEIASLFGGGGFYLVVGGKKYHGRPKYSVEGYNWDCFYSVREGWASAGEICDSFADLVGEYFWSSEGVETDEADGVYEVEEEPEVDDEDDDGE